MARSYVSKDGAKWLCDFAEKDGNHASWQCSTLRFEKREQEPPARVAPRGAKAKAAAPPDSSEDEADLDVELSGLSEDDDGPVQKAAGWKRDGNYRMGQRAKDCINDTSRPKHKLSCESLLYHLRHLRAEHRSQLHAAALQWCPAESHHAQARQGCQGGASDCDQGPRRQWRLSGQAPQEILVRS